MKVALGTNVLVSAFATRGLCADVLNIVLAEHQLIVGATVLAQLERVLRGKIRAPAKLVAEVVALLRDEGVVVSAAAPLQTKLRDATDVAVLSEAVAGGADVLVSGDRELLETGEDLPVSVLTPREFWKRLRTGVVRTRLLSGARRKPR